MLKRLYIANFILIDELECFFDKGFTTITGETGAGKSIILGALQYLCGDRMDSKVFKHNEKKLVLEAEFSLNSEVFNWLKINNFDILDNLIFRRELSPSGKSRNFINDTPCSLQQLSECAANFIDIHTQGANFALLESRNQTHFLDVFAGNDETFSEYDKNYKQLKQLERELTQVEEQIKQQIREREFVSFQYNELQAANFANFDYESAQEQINLFENKERIIQSIDFACKLLDDDELGSIPNLKKMINQLRDTSKIDVQLNEFIERINSVIIELEDVLLALENKREGLDFAGDNLDDVLDKIEIINKLLFKHNVQNIAELKEIEGKFEKQLQQGDDIEKQRVALIALKESANANCIKLAKIIDKNRKENTALLQQKLEEIFKQLGLKDAQIRFNLIPFEKLKSTGLTEVEILFNANKGGKWDLLKKASSGGELSRVMLAMKYIMANKSNLSVMIFDEVDTGVSGEIAQKMGFMMQSLSETKQLVAVTHSPQIAGISHQQFLVKKESKETGTSTILQALNKDERVNVLAQMLSGERITEAALKNAKELLIG